MFKVVGKIKGKRYVSKKRFSTQEGALKYAYSLTYTAGGNKKKKYQLTDWRIVKA